MLSLESFCFDVVNSTDNECTFSECSQVESHNITANTLNQIAKDTLLTSKNNYTLYSEKPSNTIKKADNSFSKLLQGEKPKLFETDTQFLFVSKQTDSNLNQSLNQQNNSKETVNKNSSLSSIVSHSHTTHSKSLNHINYKHNLAQQLSSNKTDKTKHNNIFDLLSAPEHKSKFRDFSTNRYDQENNSKNSEQEEQKENKKDQENDSSKKQTKDSKIKHNSLHQKHINYCLPHYIKNTETPIVKRQQKTTKPLLEPPKIGIFALYHVLTKMGIFSENLSYSYQKDEVEYLHEEIALLQQKRIQEIKSATEDEKAAKNWSTASKVWSWFLTFTSILAGIALIATGAGAITGGLLIASGILAITNQLLQLTNGWHYIAKHILPDCDSSLKSSIIQWMQIGVAIVTLAMAIVGVVASGGISALGGGLQIAQSMFSSVVVTGIGVSLIGQGISSSNNKFKIHTVKKHEAKLLNLRNQQSDYTDFLKDSSDILEQLLKDLSVAFGFIEETAAVENSLFRG